MSSILAFLAAAVVKVIPPRDDKVTRLKAEIDDLKRQCGDLRFEVDRWMTLASNWRRRYEDLTRPQMQALQATPELDAQFRTQQARMMLQQNAQAQAQTQALRNAYNEQSQAGQQQHGLYNQGLLGAQALNPEMFCNCVPARHDLFLRG